MLAKQVLPLEPHTSSPFCSVVFFGDGVLNYLPGLASDLHPPDLSSQLARITGMSHQCSSVGSYFAFVVQGVATFLVI
jgi:hypothetical protein